MSEQSDSFDADSVASPATPTDSSGLNGTGPGRVVGIAEPAGVGESTDLPASREVEPLPDAPGPAGDAITPDDGAAFLAKLASSMQATAGIERKRLEEDAERRRAAHVEGIGARRESEAARMRELAAEDLKGIDDWAEAERQRIGQERDDRAAALQQDLDTSLAEHGARIEREIAAVEAAIVSYRADVNGFFTRLDQEEDPVELARQARLRPHFPDLDAVSAVESESSAEAAAPVGVMDADAAADPDSAWSRWNASAVAPVDATGTPAPQGSEGIPTEAIGEAARPTGSLLQSVPTYRPFVTPGGEQRED
ncbi:MAG: hypothetical protein ACJ77F_02450 [Chloroflexota bacterium]